ncbi:hypothetical protein AAIB33_04070 [Microbacterium sp. AZCO]|uniref:hypothetical protein n=1 Tax=Microbacterium sp. AZCO TaxID=3142976 RepID=UPI0031F39C70
MGDDEFWHQRFVQYDTQARALQSKVFELIAIGLTAVAAFAGVAVSYSRYEILAFIPIICILLWAVALRMLHEHLLLSAYRDFYEMHATRVHAGTAVSEFDSWRQLGGRKAMKGLANYYAFSILAIVTIGLVWGSLWFLATVQAVPTVLLVAEWISATVALVVGVVVVVASITDHSRLEAMLGAEITRLHL